MDRNDRTQQLIPPFTAETAGTKVQAAEDAWNTRNPETVSRLYSEDSEWRHRDAFFMGREAIEAFLTLKWAQQLHYRLMKKLWSYHGNRISVGVESEWQDATSGQWYRTHGNELWEFNDDGLVCRQDTSTNDIPIAAQERRIGV